MPEPSTSRLSLYKPLSDGSENVNVQTDLNQNWDRVDTAVGFQACTSSTRPSSPYAGKPIMETDTSYRTFFSNGTSPASASWVEIPNSSATYTGLLAQERASAATTATQIKVTGDSQQRLTIGADGKLAWGSGSATGDTVLYRETANVLASDDIIRVYRSATSENAFSARVTGDTASRWFVNADGNMNWGPGGGSAADAALARSSTGTLTLTGNLTVTGVGQMLFARKTADTSRSSTTTMADDPHLTVSLSASATYLLFAYLAYQAGTTGDFNIAFTQPSGAAGSWQGTGLGRDVGASVGTGGWTVRMNTNDIGATQPRSYGGDTTNQAVQVMGIVRTSSAGTFAAQWAQASSDATATILRTDSWMQLVRVA